MKNTTLNKTPMQRLQPTHMAETAKRLQHVVAVKRVTRPATAWPGKRRDRNRCHGRELGRE